MAHHVPDILSHRHGLQYDTAYLCKFLVGTASAVPMLVYGLAVAPREAIGISLAAVGATTDAAMRSGLPHTPRRIGILAVVGLCTGVLSGLFGVGGGFVIVPPVVSRVHD